LSLIESALRQAGNISRVQLEQIEAQRDALLTKDSELADWKQRYASLAERQADPYPKDVYVQELVERIRKLEHELELTRQEVDDWTAKYRGSWNRNDPEQQAPQTDPAVLTAELRWWRHTHPGEAAEALSTAIMLSKQ
jgi:hypothetical protein